MSKLYFSIIGALLVAASASGQSVGIGTTTPSSTAILDVNSTTKGLLVPRLTQAQRTAIASPAQGLLVYQTDGTQPGFYYNSTAGTATWLWLPDKVSAGDNLGNGTATSAVKLNGNSLSNSGTGGITIDNGGNLTQTGNSTVTGNLSVTGTSNTGSSTVNGTSTVTGNQSVGGALAVGIGTADTKAALDVTSTTKGLLPPRMTKVQRDAISSPPVGLLIVQTDNTPGLYQYTATGWTSVGVGTYYAESMSSTAAPTTLVTVAPAATNLVYTDNASTTIGRVSLGSGTEGQRLVIVNRDTQYLPVTSASGTGNILPGYAARYIYTDGSWRRES